MIIKFVMKFLPTCLPSGLTVAAPDAFGRIPGVILRIWWPNCINNQELWQQTIQLPPPMQIHKRKGLGSDIH